MAVNVSCTNSFIHQVFSLCVECILKWRWPLRGIIGTDRIRLCPEETIGKVVTGMFGTDRSLDSVCGRTNLPLSLLFSIPNLKE